MTTGGSNTFLGYEADADAVGDSYHVRIGHYGGIKYCTAYVTLDSSYTTPADGDAAHAGALFIIPKYSRIIRVTATVVRRGAGTHDFCIQYSATTDTASGTGLTSGIEALGADVDTGSFTTRSQATPNGVSNILASSDDTSGMTWISEGEHEASSKSWIGSSDVGFYIVHAGSNSSSDPGNDPIIQLTVEYMGHKAIAD